MEEQEILTTPAACEYLHLTKTAIYRLVRIGRLSAYKPSGKLYFRRKDLDDFLNSNRIEAREERYG